jgi:2-dehydropantoate 2-reductase
MRVTIVGAGALGSLFGALLAEVAGITMLDRSPEVVRAIQRDGLRLVEGDQIHKVRVFATGDPVAASGADICMVMVKSYGTAWAAQVARRVLATGGLALTLQNGLGNRELLAGALGPERVWQGVTAQGATLLAPGEVRHAGNGPTHLETRPDIAGRAGEIAALFNRAGLETHLSSDLAGILWGKLIVNAGINALTALLRVPNGMLAEAASTRRLVARVVNEAAQVALARGIVLPYLDPEARVLEVCRATAANRSSMLQDVLRGSPTEIDAINGAIVREARALGLLAPANEMLYDLMCAQEETAGMRIRRKEEVT